MMTPVIISAVRRVIPGRFQPMNSKQAHSCSSEKLRGWKSAVIQETDLGITALLSSD